MKIKDFVTQHYKHFNAAALVDAAKAYEEHIAENKKMMITIAGAMSTAEIGKSLAEIIRQKKSASYFLYRCKFRRRFNEFSGS